MPWSMAVLTSCKMIASWCSSRANATSTPSTRSGPGTAAMNASILRVPRSMQSRRSSSSSQTTGVPVSSTSRVGTSRNRSLVSSVPEPHRSAVDFTRADDAGRGEAPDELVDLVEVA